MPEQKIIEIDGVKFNETELRELCAMFNLPIWKKVEAIHKANMDIDVETTLGDASLRLTETFFQAQGAYCRSRAMLALPEVAKEQLSLMLSDNA